MNIAFEALLPWLMSLPPLIIFPFAYWRGFSFGVSALLTILGFVLTRSFGLESFVAQLAGIGVAVGVTGIAESAFRVLAPNRFPWLYARGAALVHWDMRKNQALATTLKCIGLGPRVRMDHALGHGKTIQHLTTLATKDDWQGFANVMSNADASEVDHYLHELSENVALHPLVEAKAKNSANSAEGYWPNLLSGYQYIYLAWQARSDYTSDMVSTKRFLSFGKWLRKAKYRLEKTALANPQSIEPYVALLIVAKGLQENREALYKLYVQIIKRDPTHHQGIKNMVDAVAERWGGQEGEGLSVVRHACKDQPDGSTLHGLIADAHISREMDEDDDDYFYDPVVFNEVFEAFKRAYPNGRLRNSLSDVIAINDFAYSFVSAGKPGLARPLLEHLKGRSQDHPWDANWGGWRDGMNSNYAYQTVLKKCNVKM